MASIVLLTKARFAGFCFGGVGAGAGYAGPLILSKAQKTKVSVETNWYSSDVGTKSGPGIPHHGAGAMLLLIEAWPDVVASFPFVRVLHAVGWPKKTGQPNSGAASDAQ